mmetsp:Transcript_43188/g.99567  ORF Transcript_43188/g.99567 Transcript_43188/m.99567 type:complete len:478 (-) Transcript_43188:117-1550(-)
MSSASAPLLANEGGGESRVPESVKKGCKKCLLYVLGVLLVIFAIAGIIQLICYNFALMGCSASKLRGYNFPGGGKSDLGGATYNLVPKVSLLIERDPVWWGSGYDLFPSDSASTISGATTGFFYKTWGPLFNTYAYEDTATSQVTMYMRQRFPQSYLFMSHVIARCDGNGPSVIVTEGSGGFIVNRIRALFKMNQGYHFQVWVDNTFVGVAQEIGQHGSGIPSILFRNSTGSTMGSSTLQSRHFHGSKDEWLVTNEEDTKIPFYANAALTLNYAFHVHNHNTKGKEDLKDKAKDFVATGDLPKTELETPSAGSSDEKPLEATNATVIEAAQLSVSEEVAEAKGVAEEPDAVTEDAKQGKSTAGKDDLKHPTDEAGSDSKSEDKADAKELKEEREEADKYRKEGLAEAEKYKQKGLAEAEKYKSEEREYRKSEEHADEQQEQKEETERLEEGQKQADEKKKESTPEDSDSGKESVVVS